MEYDYIVVGAGAAGCVLANRLSAGDASVLLLEAGGKPGMNSKIPAAFNKTFQTKDDWAYTTVPQENLNGRELYWPRGKMLGGSTSLNAMIYQRGHRSTYDKWAAAGLDGWSYQDVLTSFIALEDQQRGASSFHGTNGELTVDDLRDPNPLSEAFVEAAVALGHPRNEDFNGESQDGFGLYQVTQRNGSRCSAAVAFLNPVLKRPNLTVETSAQVTRVLFDGTRTTGVEWVQNQTRRQASVRREVVLSGGAVNSPQILMLSGIGPVHELDDHAIELVHDSPNVGQNLQDHLAAMVTYAVSGPITLAQAEKPKQLFNYFTRKTGMLTSNVGESGGFVTLGGGAMPDLQYHFAPAYFLRHGFDSPETDGLTIGPTLVDVKSVGEITLVSGDPLAAPRIDPRYFSHPDDLEVMVKGVKLGREIAAEQPLAGYCTSEYTPGSEVRSDDEIAEYLRNSVETLYHPVGTCAMGSGDDAVLDAELRVRGVSGLRVADASAMPSIINANTQAISMVIGHKAAELIAS